MKKIVIIMIILGNLGSLFGGTEVELLKDIKILIEQNGKKIEQNGKKIELNSRKIDILEANNVYFKEKFNFLQNLIFIILAGVFGIPMYFDNKRQKEDLATKDKVKDIITALKELAQDDPKIRRSLDVAGIT